MEDYTQYNASRHCFDAKNEWTRLVDEHQQRTGCSRSKAVSHIAKKYPALREQMVAEANRYPHLQGAYYADQNH
ncbi:hypothetical protein [Aeoliella mucimassa]|uniref:Uncharacterized protein n=1 Tax=Aeoliella mucimassa TaxID=2527972 RepID=A0A518AN59_9BACT|nr:hypothetical protein [Aeoliella mucimassa]QDU56158.1 hypothetical protein Pan181_23620 [Aeoliella mucimassa]